MERSRIRDPLRVPWEMSLHAESAAASDREAVAGVETPVASLVPEPPQESEPAVKACLAGGCHGAMDGRGLHERVAAGSCLRCHVPAAAEADHRFDLVADDGGVCRTCHPMEASKGSVHRPFGEGKCASCHDPHGRGERRLLRADTEARLCARCHEPSPAPLKHGPYAEGRCSACHEPHQSEFKALGRAKSADLCLSCHDRPIESPGRTKPVVNMAAVLAGASFKHGAIREGDCSGCHSAHGSESANLLHKRFPAEFYQDYDESLYELCFQCHSRQLVLDERTTTVTNFRDGDRNLHYLHVNREKGRSCRACHEIHASNLPFHLRASVPFGEWELPVGFQQTETGGTCRSGCHKELGHEYKRAIDG